MYSSYEMNKKREKFFWENAIFIFDSSALLDFYFFPKEARSNIFSNIIEKNITRFWIPNHVAYEYFKNKNTIINKPIIENYEPLETKIKKIKNNFEKYLKNEISSIINETKHADKHPHINQENLIKYKKEIEEFQGRIDYFEKIIFKEISMSKKEITNTKEIDDVELLVNKIKIGKESLFKDLIEITKEGKHRYEYKIPPGYGDLKKGEKKGTQIFGDLIIWKQILDYAKEIDKPIIFITNDTKKDDDWCYLDNKKRVKKPREELIKEIKDFSNSDFWIYDQSQFLHFANIYLKSTIKEKTIMNITEYLDNKDLKKEEYLLAQELLKHKEDEYRKQHIHATFIQEDYRRQQEYSKLLAEEFVKEQEYLRLQGEEFGKEQEYLRLQGEEFGKEQEYLRQQAEEFGK